MTRFRYSGLAWKAFGLAFGPRMKLGVRDIRVAGIPDRLPGHLPLLLVSNHTSWWDGFILRPVQQLVRPDGALHIIMKEEELSKRPFLRSLGGVGFEPESVSSFRALLRDLRQERQRDPASSVLFFPQGRIWPSYRRPLGFLGGVRLVAEALAPTIVLPMGLHLENGKHPAPTAFVSFGTPIQVERQGPSPEFLEQAVSDELDAIHHFLGDAGEDADKHWPSRGVPLARAPKKVLERR